MAWPAQAEQRGGGITLPFDVVEEKPDTVVVQPGDHMWKISCKRLEEVLGRDPANEEVSGYWREVVAANEGRIRSGDPNLIFPGEVLMLPSD